MATYKKRGAKKSLSSEKIVDVTEESTTAEVFETLDNTASKTEEWVFKYQNIILVSIGLVAMIVLSILVIKILLYFLNLKRQQVN